MTAFVGENSYLMGQMEAVYMADALNIMQDFLQSFPDVRGVYTFNGPIAIGAVQALRAAGKKPGEVIVTTLDLEGETTRQIEEGWIQMTAISQPVQMAALAVEVAVRAARGEKVPAETLTQSVMVTKNSMATADLSGQTCPQP